MSEDKRMTDAEIEGYLHHLPANPCNCEDDNTLCITCGIRQAVAQLTADLAAARASVNACDNHQPGGGTRGSCLVCAVEKLSAAISRIDYLCGEPNEMGVSIYDTYPDEGAVVDRVNELTKQLAAANAIVEKTADGVPVSTLTHVWVRQANSVEGGPIEMREVMPAGRIAYRHPDSYGFIGARSSMCYSTPAAAEAARTNGGG